MARKKQETTQDTKLLDIASIFDAASTDLDPAIFETDLGLPKATSIIDWVIGDNFRKSTIFARQAEIMVRLFADYCPQCTDMSYLDNPGVGDSIQTFLSKVKVLDNGFCTSCKRDRKELFTIWWNQVGRDKYPEFRDRDFMMPYELVGCVGQRAGKSTMTSGMAATYQLHRHLSLKDPISYYGTAPDSPFQITFVSTVVEGALRNLWPNFHGAVRNAPWFKQFRQTVQEEEKKLKLKPETLFKIRDTAVSAPIKYMYAAVQAAEEEALRGATRIFAAVDELAFMSTDDHAKHASANKTYYALSNSLRTVRSVADKRFRATDIHPIQGIMVNVSSPAHRTDKIMTLLDETKRSPRAVGFHLATWEVNPEITRDDLQDEELRNPTEFWKNFGAVPPFATETFVGSPDLIGTLQTSKKSPVTIQTTYKDIAGEKHVAGVISQVTPDKSTPRVLTIDCGWTNNAFAVGMFHVSQENGDFYINTDTIFSAIPEVEPDGKRVKVHFPAMADLVLELRKHFNIKHVLYDRWQSISDIQRLRLAGLDALMYSPTGADFDATKAMLEQTKIRILTPEKAYTAINTDDIHDLRLNPGAHFAYQIATVRKVGNKVVKPNRGDDDMWRVLVLAVSKIRKDFSAYAAINPGAGPRSGAQGPAPIRGVVLGRSGRSFSGGGGGSANVKGVVLRKSSR